MTKPSTPLVPSHASALFRRTMDLYKLLRPTSTPESRLDEASWAEAQRRAAREIEGAS